MLSGKSFDVYCVQFRGNCANPHSYCTSQSLWARGGEIPQSGCRMESKAINVISVRTVFGAVHLPGKARNASARLPLGLLSPDRAGSSGSEVAGEDSLSLVASPKLCLDSLLSNTASRGFNLRFRIPQQSERKLWLFNTNLTTACLADNVGPTDESREPAPRATPLQNQHQGQSKFNRKL
jgi:hypothetical protein